MLTAFRPDGGPRRIVADKQHPGGEGEKKQVDATRRLRRSNLQRNRTRFKEPAETERKGERGRCALAATESSSKMISDRDLGVVKEGEEVEGQAGVGRR